MMINRRAAEERRKVQQIIDRAVQRARAPGSSFGTSSTQTGGTATVSPAITGTFTMPDENGNTLHGFMLDVDTLDSDTARLF